MNTTKLGACLENFPFWDEAQWIAEETKRTSQQGIRTNQIVWLGMKTGDGPRFIVVNVENGVQFGDLQKVADFLVQVQKL